MGEDLPKPKEPEYKSWPLEKLQQEYFKQGLELSSLRIRNATADYELEVVDRFIDAFEELQSLRRRS